MPPRRFLVPVLLAVAALVIAGTATADHVGSVPTIDVTGPAVIEATDGDGEPMSFSVTANDAEDGDLTADVTCNRESGVTIIPVDGSDTVTCSVTDADGHTVEDMLTQTWQDTSPPVFSNVPADQSVNAGDTVTYTAPTATDAVDGARPVVCTPASGFTATATVVVECDASDTRGNDGTAMFTVTVNGAPTLSLPGTLTVEAISASGAVVTYSAFVSASDAEDGPLTPDCLPASGTLFPIGTTTVACTVTDTDGLADSGSFDVVVQDSSAPLVTAPASRTVEANGPNGSIVNYEPPTAVDAVDGPLLATCNRPSGSLFPVGVTLVTCTATDSDGQTGAASFTVTVEDTTAPILTAPATFAVQSTTPVPITDPRIQAFLESATATDIVDLDVEIVLEGPEVFPLGTTAVVFRAEDDAGNVTEKNALVTVTTEAVGPPGGDTTPPDNIRRVRAVAGNLSVSISWRLPQASDFDHVEIVRTPGLRGAPESVVYEGRKTSFVARGLKAGVEYRFVIVAYDEAGNRAAGVAVIVFAERQNLVAPVNGAVVAAPRRFVWRAVPGADYYNIQFWRNGKKLSAWPTRARFTLRGTWRFDGKRQRLVPGTWHVYVWPGFGRPADAEYGRLHVNATFVVRRR